MRTMTIEGGIHSDVLTGGFGIRQIRVTDFKTPFLLVRMFAEQTTFFRYVILDELTGSLICSGKTIRGTLERFEGIILLLDPKELDEFINNSTLPCL